MPPFELWHHRSQSQRHRDQTCSTREHARANFRTATWWVPVDKRIPHQHFGEDGEGWIGNFRCKARKCKRRLEVMRSENCQSIQRSEGQIRHEIPLQPISPTMTGIRLNNPDSRSKKLIYDYEKIQKGSSKYEEERGKGTLEDCWTSTHLSSLRKRLSRNEFGNWTLWKSKL